MRQQLLLASKRGYENDIAFVVSKILLRDKSIANALAKAEAALREAP